MVGSVRDTESLEQRKIEAKYRVEARSERDEAAKKAHLDIAEECVTYNEKLNDRAARRRASRPRKEATVFLPFYPNRAKRRHPAGGIR